jgi:Domain of unknown function (DUF6457)
MTHEESASEGSTVSAREDIAVSAREDNPGDVLDDWIDAVCGELGIERDAAARKTILDLARVVAHRVDRPAAPLTAFLLGRAVGAGEPLSAAAQRIVELARGWPRPE